MSFARVESVEHEIQRHYRALRAIRTRKALERSALWAEIGDSLLERFRDTPAVADRLVAIEAEVTAGSRTPAAAARLLLAAFMGKG